MPKEEMSARRKTSLGGNLLKTAFKLKIPFISYY